MDRLCYIYIRKFIFTVFLDPFRSTYEKFGCGDEGNRSSLSKSCDSCLWPLLFSYSLLLCKESPLRGAGHSGPRFEPETFFLAHRRANRPMFWIYYLLSRFMIGTLPIVIMVSYKQCCGSGMFIPDPGSWFLSIPGLGSRIQEQQQEREGGKNSCHTFFVAQISQNCKLFYFWTGKEKLFSQFTKNYSTF